MIIIYSLNFFSVLRISCIKCCLSAKAALYSRPSGLQIEEILQKFTNIGLVERKEQKKCSVSK
jgi:hypothetical protein